MTTSATPAFDPAEIERACPAVVTDPNRPLNAAGIMMVVV